MPADFMSSDITFTAVPFIHTRCSGHVKARKYAASRATRARRGELADATHGCCDSLLDRLQVVSGLCTVALVVRPGDDAWSARDQSA